MSDLARDPKQIGNLIRRARQRQGLTQGRLLENGNAAARLLWRPAFAWTRNSPIDHWSDRMGGKHRVSKDPILLEGHFMSTV